jgi:hypothetical protein
MSSTVANEIKMARQRCNHQKRTVARGRLLNAEYLTR